MELICYYLWVLVDVEDEEWPPLDAYVVDSTGVSFIEISLEVEQEPPYMYNTMGYVIDWWRGERNAWTIRTGSSMVINSHKVITWIRRLLQSKHFSNLIRPPGPDNNKYR